MLEAEITTSRSRNWLFVLAGTLEFLKIFEEGDASSVIRSITTRKQSTNAAASLSAIGQASVVCVAVAAARFPSNAPLAKFIGTAIVVVWALVKEFWFDKNFEDAVTRGSDIEDFLYYIVGATAALLILWGS